MLAAFFFAHITFVKGHLDTQGLLVCSSGIVPDGETTFDGVILKSLHYEHETDTGPLFCPAELPSSTSRKIFHTTFIACAFLRAF